MITEINDDLAFQENYPATFRELTIEKTFNKINR